MELDSARRAVFSVWVEGQDDRGIDVAKLDPALETRTQFGTDSGLLGVYNKVYQSYSLFMSSAGLISSNYWLSVV